MANEMAQQHLGIHSRNISDPYPFRIPNWTQHKSSGNILNSDVNDS